MFPDDGATVHLTTPPFRGTLIDSDRRLEVLLSNTISRKPQFVAYKYKYFLVKSMSNNLLFDETETCMPST